jgi:uridine nucleosidase
MEKPKIHVWLDCDPGLDDIMAIILAAGEPRINLLGVSTSPGNSSIENTTRNALDILYNIGRSDIPVIMGA